VSFEDYVSKWRKWQCCKDIDASYYGLTIAVLKELVFKYDEHNGIVREMNKEKKCAGLD
jgi:hypothetical protein